MRKFLVVVETSYYGPKTPTLCLLVDNRGELVEHASRKLAEDMVFSLNTCVRLQEGESGKSYQVLPANRKLAKKMLAEMPA